MMKRGGEPQKGIDEKKIDETNKMKAKPLILKNGDYTGELFLI